MQDDRLIVAFNESGAVERFGIEHGDTQSKRIDVDWGDGIIESVQSGPTLRRVRAGLLDRYRLACPEEMRETAKNQPQTVLAAIVFEQDGRAIDGKTMMARVRELGLDPDDIGWKRAREALRDLTWIEVTGSGQAKYRWGHEWADSPHPLQGLAPTVDDLVRRDSRPDEEAVIPEQESQPDAPDQSNASEVEADPAPRAQDDPVGERAAAVVGDGGELGEEAGEHATPSTRPTRPRETLRQLVDRARDSSASFEIESSALAMLATRDARANDLGPLVELAETSAPSWRESSQLILFEHIGRILQNDKVDPAPATEPLRRLLGRLDPIVDPRWAALVLPMRNHAGVDLDDDAFWSPAASLGSAPGVDAALAADRRLREIAAARLGEALPGRAAPAEAARLLQLPETVRSAVSPDRFADALQDVGRSDEAGAAWLSAVDQSKRIEELKRRAADLTDDISRVQDVATRSAARADELQHLVDDLRDQLNGAAAQRAEVADRERVRVQRRALRGIAQQLALLDEELGISDPESLRAHARSLAERLGVRAFADLNESAEFDALKHESPETISNGDLVTVVRPGYTSQSDGDAVLIKALVALSRDEEWRNRS